MPVAAEGDLIHLALVDLAGLVEEVRVELILLEERLAQLTLAEGVEAEAKTILPGQFQEATEVLV
jgi:hypothetical protein